MTDDLARLLTDTIRQTPGVVMVLPTRPIVYAATEGLADALDLPEPPVVVDVDGPPEATVVTVHLSTSVSHPTADTLRAVGSAVREALATVDARPAAIVVKARVIEDAPAS